MNHDEVADLKMQLEIAKQLLANREAALAELAKRLRVMASCQIAIGDAIGDGASRAYRHAADLIEGLQK